MAPYGPETNCRDSFVKTINRFSLVEGSLEILKSQPSCSYPHSSYCTHSTKYTWLKYVLSLGETLTSSFGNEIQFPSQTLLESNNSCLILDGPSQSLYMWLKYLPPFQYRPIFYGLMMTHGHIPSTRIGHHTYISIFFQAPHMLD